MDTELIKRLFPGASKSTYKRNETSPKIPASELPADPIPFGVRIRQSKEEPLNKLEAEWYEIIRRQFPNYPPPRPQCRRYKLGNGIWYKPDFVASSWPQTSGPAIETAWEVKGPKAFRGGFENLKVAAHSFPEVRWLLVWKEKGEWRQQIVLP